MTNLGAEEVRVSAPAKINLALRVLAREDSGFHQLETLFCAVGFEDLLSLRLRGSGISLEIDGPDLGPIEENLVYRAAEGFLALAGHQIGVEIQLTKRIPVQGGLGGGSSDAAATLKALNLLLPASVEDADLVRLAGDLGADVPFFLSGSPLALGWGRGDRLLPLPALPTLPVLLAIPPFGVSTPEAYRLLSEERSRRVEKHGSELYSLETFGSWDGIRIFARNDFEGSVFGSAPLLKRLREALSDTQPMMSLLSGSGSALFAVFDDEGPAQRAAVSLKAAFPETSFILTHTRAGVQDPTLGGGVEE